MYESLRGRLTEKAPSRCVVEAGGIGYAVSVPLSTYERLPSVGDEAALRVHVVVPERGGDWRMFGFATTEERALFRACLSVSGVGPATALALLSGLPPAELRSAIASRDVRSLTRVKGVGKKTAERLIVELGGALGSVSPDATAGMSSPGPVGDAAAALVTLGLDAAEASHRLSRISNAAAMPVAELVRRALRG